MLALLLLWVGLALGGTPNCGKTQLSSLPEGDPQDAGTGNYPSMCSLFTHLAGVRVFMGGASLVSNNQLVTLATLVAGLQEEDGQCGEEPLSSELSVICGTVDVFGGTEGTEVQERKVSRIFIHPEYSATALTNDIAVLLLEKPLNFTETVSQACLPRPDEEFDVDTTCVAVGHGKDGPDDSNNLQLYSNTLAAVTLPLWDSVKCTAELNSKHFKPKHDLSWRAHKSHLCAGGEEGRDTCTGDGGGPLFCVKKVTGGDTVIEDDLTADLFDIRGTDEKKLTLVQSGITAWGIGCGMAGLPAIYSNLASAACWIDQVMSCYMEEENTAQLVNLRTQARKPASLNEFTEGECAAWLKKWSEKGACGCSQRLAESPNAADFGLRSTGGDDDAFLDLNYDDSYDE
jgi:secreted trypsin-like serine protease